MSVTWTPFYHSRRWLDILSRHSPQQSPTVEAAAVFRVHPHTLHITVYSLASMNRQCSPPWVSTGHHPLMPVSWLPWLPCILSEALAHQMSVLWTVNRVFVIQHAHGDPLISPSSMCCRRLSLHALSSGEQKGRCPRNRFALTSPGRGLLSTVHLPE